MEVDWEVEEEEVEEDGGISLPPNMMLRSPFQREPFWPFFMVAAGEGRSETLNNKQC